MPSVEALTVEQLREALRLLGRPVPSARTAAARSLRETLAIPGVVHDALDHAPDGARQAFVALVHDGPATVQDLLGRGWWGQGVLPPPLDWLQRRAFALVSEDGLVSAADEARAALLHRARDNVAADPEPEGVRVEDAGSVVVAARPELLDRALIVSAAALRAIAPTVAASSESADVVAAALRAAGVRLADDLAVTARIQAPALPGTAEDAIGPWAVRALLERALDESRQVRLRYYASSRGGAATDRVVDPWSFEDDLLRGYCHLRAGERAFAVDRIGFVRLLPTPVQESEPPR